MGIRDTPQGALSVRDRFAHKILEGDHRKIRISEHTPPFFHAQHENGVAAPLTVGIVGAGAAGLYTAMILKDLGIEYEILEANSTIGGRLLTHQFSPAPNDYYVSRIFISSKQ
jgi:hypothetical protein